ncbi:MULTISPECIES: acyl-CoA thioesterase [Shouchella]|uniref:Thioesterase family protein n=2 Tax=Shouchella TaxID=2893057 RepID=A0ABY7W5B1_9BACI|nr:MULTISPECIES: thioesterase family protein [Shouchella]MED4129236.1 thioesterase family protein [Shouchella miscanthi]WDF04145.1 thioesterase family protein [Shouchella hunanensis]GAF24053.1 4-hydroxybenzoyl-CoA thioesterase family [Bacillus sp. JCM 19047]
MRLPAYIENLEDWKKEFDFFTDISVRFSETDAFGHVNNTVAFIYFEQARLAFFESKGLMEEWLKGNGLMIVTADLQCDYVAQMKYGDQVNVGVKIQQLGTSSMELHYLGLVNDQPTLLGRGSLVQIDGKTGKASPFQESIKQKIRI